jgi:ABC-type transporter Mla subunit MlaD
VAKEVHKLQQLSDGDSNPHIQELRAHHNELVKGHNALVEAFNNNHRQYSQIQQQLDIRLGAAYSAIQDLVDSLNNVGNNYTSLVHMAPEVGTAGMQRVNWQKYIEQHIETLQIELARIQVEKQALDENKLDSLEKLEEHLQQQNSPLVTPEPEASEDEEPATVFGGDHAQAQPQDQSPAT